MNNSKIIFIKFFTFQIGLFLLRASCRVLISTLNGSFDARLAQNPVRHIPLMAAPWIWADWIGWVLSFFVLDFLQVIQLLGHCGRDVKFFGAKALDVNIVNLTLFQWKFLEWAQFCLECHSFGVLWMFMFYLKEETKQLEFTTDAPSTLHDM